MLFYRLLQQAMVTAPVIYQSRMQPAGHLQMPVVIRRTGATGNQGIMDSGVCVRNGGRVGELNSPMTDQRPCRRSSDRLRRRSFIQENRSDQLRTFPDWYVIWDGTAWVSPLHGAKGAPVFPQDRTGVILVICRFWLGLIAHTSQWHGRVFDLFDLYPSIPLRSMGLPQEWREHPLWKD
jgi:hypothetical protein